MKLFSKIFGSSNSRKLKKLKRSVTQISALEEGLKGLSDDQLKAKTVEFQERIAGGESVDACKDESHLAPNSVICKPLAHEPNSPQLGSAYI